ncbi:MAG TPA: 4Fe-4S binding protein [Bacteroidales bacterium]|nr:4Fe-4S binding protein [Bacteroidales bacterium]
MALSVALAFGVDGLAIIFFLSRRKGKMVQCTLWYPIGTIVNYYKRISPFRMYIDNACTSCMICTRHCRYDALGKPDILNHKPGITCTLCGDCVTSCPSGAIRYKFLNLSPRTSRYLYLFISISLHVITLSMARI